MPPKRIKIVSDNNEIELIKFIKQKLENIYEYKFVKSETKLGMLMTISEKELNKNLSNKIFIEIK